MMDEKELFTVARLYGFRNIQMIQKNLKKGLCKYLYVEIMACPGGCVAGGGQTKPADKETKNKDMTKNVIERLTDPSVKTLILPENNPCVQRLHKDFIEEIPLHTSFKAISEEIFSASKLKW